MKRREPKFVPSPLCSWCLKPHALHSMGELRTCRKREAERTDRGEDHALDT